MRRAAIYGLLLAACLGAPVLSAQVVVDRVVARIENDIITLSDVRELAAYQRLSGRQPAPEPDLLPAEVYGTLSPAVNLRLRAFNERLQEMLKP